MIEKLITASSLLFLGGGAVAAPTTLLCRANVDGRPALVQAIKMDPERKEVDGKPAVFSDTEITWSTISTDAGVVRYTDHTLNRLAGTYRSWGRGAIYPSMPPLFSCEKAPPARF